MNNTCEDVDECALGLDNCSVNGVCLNLPGSFHCFCLAGWGGDGVTCDDVDECTLNVNRNHTCTETEICKNNDGGFACDPIDCDSIENSVVVTCDYHGMVISFPKCVYENFRLKDFYLDGPYISTGKGISASCHVQNDNDGDIWYNWIVQEDNEMCGTVLTNNGTHAIFKNAVQKSEDWGSNSVINRGVGTLIHFTCAYELEVQISLRAGIDVKSAMDELRLAEQLGAMHLSAGIFKDQMFEELANPLSIMVVPAEIYFGISMDSWDTSFTVMLEKCWVTPTSNPRDDLKYIFIDDFCGDYYEENVFNTLNIYQNGGSTDAMFSLRSFTWSRQQSSILHFHCLVSYPI